MQLISMFVVVSYVVFLYDQDLEQLQLQLNQSFQLNLSSKEKFFFFSEFISTRTKSVFAFCFIGLSHTNIHPGACVTAKGSFAWASAEAADTPQAQKQQISSFFG